MDQRVGYIHSFVWCLMVFMAVWCCTVVKGCPQGCHCDSRKVTTCLNSNLTSIPQGIPKDTEQLYLKGNRIKRLQQESFSSLSSLKRLVLNKCDIEYIEPNAFSGLVTLTDLDLRGNKITELQSYSFSGLFNLKTLNLKSNKLETVHNFAFHGLNLTRLNLEENKHLAEISGKAFHGTRIRDLYLYDCNLSPKSMDSIRTLQSSLRELHMANNKRPLIIPQNQFQGFMFRKLKLAHNHIKDASFLEFTTADDLDLAGNPIGPIDFSQYPNLRQVRNLRLDHTKFNVVDGKYFSGITHLSQLYLSNNGIETLPINLHNIFLKLQRLSLENNPLHCNCELQWFKRFLRSTSVHVTGANCQTPNATKVAALDEDDFKCVEPSLISITKNVSVSESGDVALSCEAEGDPAPRITWEMPGGESKVTKSPTNKQLFRNKGVLRIQTSSLSDAGKYTCVARNPAGNATAMANLAVYKVVNSGPSLQQCMTLFGGLISILIVYLLEKL